MGYDTILMEKVREKVVVGFVGVELDRGLRADRWSRWRPTVSLAQHDDLALGRVELLFDPRHRSLAETVADDVRRASPETTVRVVELPLADPWDFEEVYGALHDWARAYPWRPRHEDYLVHITTGTHVCQICLFLLTESRRIPGRLLQTSPRPRSDDRGGDTKAGSFRVIDLDLSRYDALASRFGREQTEGVVSLKGGIETRNVAFNLLIERVEYVAAHSAAPILLMGPTGAGKSQLAARIHALRLARHRVTGAFVDVNCATLRGDGAMSALFGHARGSFTGAVSARAGLLRQADGGTLFLDEVGELGDDEQAMLLRALEEKSFYPVGSDTPVRSDFLLVAGTNRDLRARVRAGRFREDLLARIDLWTFTLPGLHHRPEDLEPNLDFELERAASVVGHRASFQGEARARFVAFAREAPWPGNFRELGAAVQRMTTLARGGRIDGHVVDEELDRLRARWRVDDDATPAAPATPGVAPRDRVEAVLGVTGAAELDRFDRVQLSDVLAVCAEAPSLSAAGRTLFAASRARKTAPNDADRLRKYLARFGLRWDDVSPPRPLP